jgi:HD-GYP domain-containing protein (c-di-GMP phosphodiesterase class II)
VVVASNLAVPEASADEHFLGHVVDSAHDVQASEDIVTVNGVKLLAKGARVDEGTRERLLAHKLARSLEQCLEVTDAVNGEMLAQVAGKLLDEQPLLRTLYGDGKSRPVVAALARLPLTTQLRSLLSLYAELPTGKLEHPVAVALIASGLARKVLPDEGGQERTLLTAGLFHDIGELYVNPLYLDGGARLGPSQWKHVVAHPVIGHRVLRDMVGAGRMVADAVLQHHERHDGFGYPKGLAGEALPMRGELLAAAEWLAGLMRSGRSSVTSASAATRLMPGGFRDSIVRAIAPAVAGDESDGGAAPTETGQVLAGLVRVSETIGRFRQSREWIEGLIDAGSGASAVLATNHVRMERIERSFVSSGLSGDEPLALFERLNAIGDAELFGELSAIVREIAWRLRELERDTLLRASALPPADEQVVREMIARLKRSEAD